MKKFLIAALFLSAFPSFAMAQQTSSCVNLTKDLRQGMKNANTNNEVVVLQNFLKTKGFLYATPNGSFGPATLTAVKKFQSSVGIGSQGTPGYGGVGPKSRAKIKEMTCGVSTITTNYPTTNASTVSDCLPGYSFNTTTGKSCITGATTAVTQSTQTSTSVQNQSTPTQSIDTSTSIKLNSCGEITKPGNYLLTDDITNTQSSACIKIQDISNVSLDCQNHTITSQNEDFNVYVKGVSDFKINNCKLVSSKTTTGGQAMAHVLRIEGSKRGDVSDNIINGSYVSVDGSSDVIISNNIFTNQFSVYKSNNIKITKNKFSNDSDPIHLQDGNSNSLISNTIDGKSDGIWRGDGKSIGADDGIVVRNESQDIIQGNIIQNIWDCGIENIGYMFDSKIIGNNVKNAGYCFLGGWYLSSVRGNLIKDNIGDNIPRLFVFFRAESLLPSEQFVYFKDNTFENNKFINPRVFVGRGGIEESLEASSIIIDATAVPSSSIVVGNNIFKNNNFTNTARPLIFRPLSMISDGGGNICPTTTETNFPLKCK